MAAIRLAFLDQVRAADGAGQAAGGLPRKLVALLGLLAVERTRSAPVERFCRLLWPDAGDALARKSLNQLLVRARVLLPGAVDRPDEHQLGLSPLAACDVHDLLFGAAFDAAAGPPAGASFEFLPGFSVRDCPELNDWLDATRTVVRGRAARAALERAGTLPLATSYPWAKLAYSLDRADERSAAAYFRALSAVQGPAAAWSAFLEHRRWLAEELDISPSARLTATVAEACQQAVERPYTGGSDAVPAAAAEPPAPADASVTPSALSLASPTRVGRSPRRRHRYELVGALAVLAALSLVAWHSMRTPPLAAGTGAVELALSPTLARGAAADSALQLASAHLAAHHDVAARVISGAVGAAALRVSLPDGARAGGQRLTVAPVGGVGASSLAAALTDSVLALLTRASLPAGTPVGFTGASAGLLREAQAALARARTLAATGGEGASLLMLSMADSVAVLAAHRQSRDWQAPVLRARIANQVFWSRLASGVVDPEPLREGVRLASAAAGLGGGGEALDARAALNFSLWVSGAPGAAAAGEAARSDYAASVVASPGRGEAWARLAQLYHAEGRLSDAYSAALQSLQLLPAAQQRLEAFMELFLAALDRGDHAAARRWCDELAFHDPGSVFAATCSAMYAWANPASTSPVAAASLTGESDAVRPSLEAQLALLRAGAELARDHAAAAQRLIEQAGPGLGRDPQVAGIWAGVLVELGQPDSALATLRVYLAGAPSRRAILARPWLRPLYQPQESWRDFSARLGVAPLP